jgi:hypothetical protein
MLFPVDVFRDLVCDDLEICCGFIYQDDNYEDLVHQAAMLPSDIAVACLLHPLVGGMLYFVLLGENKTLLYLTFLHVFDCLNVLPGRKRLLKSEVMSNSQYEAAKAKLLSRLQTTRENESRNRT